MTELSLTAPHPPPLLEAIRRLESWCNVQLAEAEARDQVVEPLYQYTTAEGLKGILESQTMWFTDFRHLNDPSEVYYGMDRIHDVLEASQRGADGRAVWFLKCLADLFSRDNMETMGFFVASFSRARDDLGQWRAYADNGRGFAIGFGPRMFETQPGLNASPEENAFEGSVLYKPAEIFDRTRQAVDQALRLFIEMADVHPELLSDKSVRLAFGKDLAKVLIAMQLIWHALTSKHPAYEHEQEFRMLMMGTVEYLLPVTKTRTRSSEIVPYIAHRPWAVREPGAIAEIMVGPAALPDTERVIRTLLATYGVTGAEIERSDIPYRAVEGGLR